MENEGKLRPGKMEKLCPWAFGIIMPATILSQPQPSINQKAHITSTSEMARERGIDNNACQQLDTHNIK